MGVLQLLDSTSMCANLSPQDGNLEQFKYFVLNALNILNQGLSILARYYISDTFQIFSAVCLVDIFRNV